MQSSELESGLPDEAEQEGIVSFLFLFHKVCWVFTFGENETLIHPVW